MDKDHEQALLGQVLQLRMQGFALRCILSTVFVELAMRSADPRATLDRLLAEITGTASGLAMRVDNPIPQDAEITRVLESVQKLAESSLSRRLRKGQ